MKKADSIPYIALHDDLFWAASCQGFAFNELRNDYRVPDLQTTYIRNGEVYSIFDSGSVSIQIPDPLFETFVKHLFAEAGHDDYTISRGNILTPCYDTFPTLHFMFDKVWLTVDVNDYVVDYSDA